MRPLCLMALALLPAADPQPTYVKKETRILSILASLREGGIPALDGKWHIIGPFDNTNGAAFEGVYPPEKEIDLAKTYPGKGGKKVAWEEFKTFTLGKAVDLARRGPTDECVVYLYHEFESKAVASLPLSLGSDDFLVGWFNGEKVVEDGSERPVAPDQNHATLKIKPGVNKLLLKIGNAGGGWAVYVAPDGLPSDWPGAIRNQLNRDFPRASAVASANTAAEAKHYRIVTLPVPNDVVLEVGGLAFRPDGKLLACTRRGDVYLIDKPDSEDLDGITFKKFATGLHEALGLHVDGKDVYVVQRPELTKLVDKNRDDVADAFVTVCDKWGVSGDYHEFAFGPARDKKGNFYVSLNVGFGGGHQAKSPWRGWCVKISPKGEMTPFATGLRSPNGLGFSPDGALFYCDNQGEWVATNKMHEIREGEFYGHQAGLLWVPKSPFAKTLQTKYPQGMLYDGEKGTQRDGFPDHTPPCIWFPYDRMGKSASEPIWDTTGGKFGPFSGQCFVGDQTKSCVMRVVLEKVKGRYQGACIPFRSGYQCGINRLAFGPDGSLFAGQTNRGWGSLGGKAHGLQRLVYTGTLPFEVHAVKLTKNGFDLTFTKPLDTATAEKLESYGVQSFTYDYHSNYGSDEFGRRAEKVSGVTVAKDRKSVSLKVDGLKVGRVYEVRTDGVKSSDGDTVLHPEAYYTLNNLP